MNPRPVARRTFRRFDRLEMESTQQRIMKRTLVIALFALLGASHIPAQSSLDLGVSGVGLSLGNSSRWTGVRINLRDRAVNNVNGFNLTLWKPHENPDFEMNGIAAGLWNPNVGTLNGIGLGVGGVVAYRAINGIAAAGLGVVSQGSMNGLSIAGLGVVTEDRIRGIALAGLGGVSEGGVDGLMIGGLGAVSQGAVRGVMVAGLGTVSQGDLIGISIAGLGAVSQQSLIGINIAGLGLVAERDMIGLNIGGLGTVAEGDMRWLNIGGLGVVANGALHGISVGGLAVVGTDRVRGISIGGLGVVGEKGHDGIAIGGVGVVSREGPLRGIALSVGRVDALDAGGILAGGYRVKADRVRGLASSILMLRTTEFDGIGIAGYTEVRGVQRGITIGLFNRADELHGIQIGLLNRAGNNAPPFRWLPLINVHF